MTGLQTADFVLRELRTSVYAQVIASWVSGSPVCLYVVVSYTLVQYWRVVSTRRILGL